VTPKELGRYGENIASLYLEKKGYEVVRRNFCAKGGEIDIIAKKDGIMAFVEVKTRKAGAMTDGFAALTKSKRGALIKCSAAYGYKFPHGLQPRFDAVSVVVDGKRVVGFDYIENAFDASL